MHSLRTSIPALRSMVAAAAVSIVFTTGCANNFLSTASAPVTAAKSGLGGSVHGGQQPIVGSTITLYAAGNKSNYGTGATVLGTPATTGSGGSFTYSDYTCPSDNTPIYLISKGGQTGGTANAGTANDAAVLMAALGPCTDSKALNNVNISEVTTVASVFALAQYMNPGTTIGSEVIGGPGDYTSATSQAGIGILNASNNVPLLANISTGQAVASTTINGTATEVAAVVVTATPETAKINTIANILAACVNNTNTSHGQCDTLFANATPPSPSVTSQTGATFNKAVDTLQAAYYMATNPTDGSATNLNALYNLNTGAAPFGAGLMTVPTDWTMGLVFNSGATKCATSGALFINYGYQLNVDASGNVWMANGGSTAANANATTELGPNGTPLNCSPGQTGARGGAVIDTAGNIWTGSNTSAVIYKFDGNKTMTTIPVANQSYAVAADGVGNIFYTGGASNVLYELPNSAVAATTPTTIGSLASKSDYTLAIDTKNTVYAGQSSTAASSNNPNSITVYPTTTVGGATYIASPGTVLTNTSNFLGVYGLSLDAGGNVWVATSAGASATTAPANTTSYVTPTYKGTAGAAQTATFAESTATTAQFAGLSNARFNAIDGAGNVWFANGSKGTNNYSISEVSNAGAALSPSGAAGGYNKSAAFFSGPQGIAVDLSGNVWTSQVSATSLTIVTEVVGAAVPVVTPIAKQLSAATGPIKPSN